ncbi:hypothetical protein CAPN002_25910 [Capnocytophaga stomatis]|uniref:DUF4133 domain-containing protein n=1 Tax=Capnocytophaga stomatis TaxID=1848904 RepID=UPI00195186E4|nr:DUF4133 domain-containing protein [Capnocytophaga stomatis]GIJ95373.1 hypothetical protein CAPN002_25910 [Capnocytophaga stomatis]
MGFYLYKGLKKPLVFFGLKNKYIYYALGFILSGIICIAILSSFIGFLGLVFGGLISAGGVWYTFRTQDKKGLYNKTKNNKELHIFPKKFRVRKIENKYKKH